MKKRSYKAVATIFDIAKKAGVSITTVSRALNGYSDVNEKTRQTIIAIAEDLHYYPNAAARSLQGKKTNTIAFAPLLNNHLEAESFFKEFTGVLALACFKYDLSLLVTLVGSDSNVEEVYRELVGSGRVDGIILADIKPEDERIGLLSDLDIPYVTFGRTTRNIVLDYPFVDVDGVNGVKKMVGYLYKQGHRRMAYLSEPLNLSYTLHRYEGYRQGLLEYGLSEDEQLVRTNLENEAHTYSVISQLLALPSEVQPTALITGSDYLALQVLQAVSRAGKVVGREAGQVAVTGFDDLPFSAYLRPGLTTLRQPITETCTVLLDLLVALLKNKHTEAPLLSSSTKLSRVGPHQFLLQPELVVRESA